MAKGKSGALAKLTKSNKPKKECLYEKKKTVRMARKAVKRSYDGFEALLLERASELALEGDMLERFEALMGKRPMAGKIRASDMAAGRKFSNLLISEVRDLARARKDLDFYSVTFLIDEGISLDREPIIPTDPLKAKMYKALDAKRLKLEGWTFVEITAINNYPQKGRGRNLLGHGHALIWTEKGQNPDTIQRFLDSSMSWSCKLGAKAVKVKRIYPHMGSPTWWAYYFSKAPHKVKNLRTFTDPDKPGREKCELWDTSKNYRPELAVILMEVLSYIPLTSCVGSIGNAKYPLSRAKAKLAIWHKARLKKKATQVVRDFDVDRFWRKTKRSRRVKYRRPIILGPEV